MNMRLPLFSCLLLLALPQFATAETLSFPEHNFAVDLPEGWGETNAPAPAPAVMTVKNADGQKTFIVVAAKVPDKERATAVRDMAGGAKAASKEKGWKITSERQVTVKGLTFDTFNAQIPDGPTVVNWMTSAGSEAYSLQGIHRSGDAASDPELQSILASFRLLTPAPANTPRYDTNSVAYQAGRVFGCILIPLGLLAAVVLVIVWLVRRGKAGAAQ